MKAIRNHRVALALLFMSFGFVRSAAADAASAPVVFDFVEKFPVAEIQTDTTVLQFGAGDSSRLLIRGWADVDGAKASGVRWGIDDESALRFFVSVPSDLPVHFRCVPFRFKDAPEQRITILVNGKTLTEIPLRARPTTYNLIIPSTALKPGSNELAFRYAYSRSPKDLNPAAKQRQRLAVAWDWLRIGADNAIAHPAADADALIVPPGTRVDYFTKVGPDTVLTVDDIGTVGAVDGAGSSKLQVEVATGSSRPRQLTIPQRSGESPRLIALGVGKEEVARVSFHALPNGHSPGDFSWRVVRPALRAPTSTAPAASQPAVGGGPQRSNIVVYLIDTLRADHLGCYGYSRPTSPYIDAFAREATLFRNAVAQSSHTVPSVTSIFSGLTPVRHGVHNKRFALPATADTLAELLQQAGYTTAAFVTNGNISGPRGLTQGFETYDYMPEDTKTLEVHQLSDRLNEHAFAWLDQQPTDRPFFLYMHATDPHGPYMPRSPHREQFSRRPHDPMLGALRKTGKRLTAADADDIIDLYDAEIAFNDASFGAVLDKLRGLGLYDQTLIMFVADHGEEFHDHGGWFHGKTLYAEMTHVPLIMKLPGGLAAGREVSGVVQQIDILPTLVAYAGGDVPPQVEGKSMLAWVNGGAPDPERPAFSHTLLRRRERDSVVVGHMKLVQLPDQRTELFDLESDPREQKNLINERDVTAGYLRTLLTEYALPNPVSLPPKKAVMDDTLKERLRALGY